MSSKYIATIKYCNLCGDQFKTQEKSVLICGQKHRFYINPKICIGALLTNSQNHLLLVKRKIEPQKGLWDIPGGFIEVGETLEEGTQRELSEELNITAQNLTYFSSGADNYTYQEVPYPTLNAFFTGEISDTNLKANDDVEDYKFFAFNKIPYDQIAFESIASVIWLFTKKQE